MRHVVPLSLYIYKFFFIIIPLHWWFSSPPSHKWWTKCIFTAALRRNILSSSSSFFLPFRHKLCHEILHFQWMEKPKGKRFFFSFFGIKCILGIVRLKNEIIIVAKKKIKRIQTYECITLTGWFSSWISPFMMNNWLPEIFINVFVKFFFLNSHNYMLKNDFSHLRNHHLGHV